MAQTSFVPFCQLSCLTSALSMGRDVMVVIIHPSHLIQICDFMSGRRTKVSASNMPHAQSGIMSSQLFLSLLISNVAVSIYGWRARGTTTLYHTPCLQNPYEHLISSAPNVYIICAADVRPSFHFCVKSVAIFSSQLQPLMMQQVFSIICDSCCPLQFMNILLYTYERYF